MCTRACMKNASHIYTDAYAHTHTQAAHIYTQMHTHTHSLHTATAGTTKCIRQSTGTNNQHKHHERGPEHRKVQGTGRCADSRECGCECVPLWAAMSGGDVQIDAPEWQVCVCVYGYVFRYLCGVVQAYGKPACGVCV